MSGHRERLRKRFLATPSKLSETERVELLLTYAIPRRDVAPLAKELLDKFGSVDKLLATSHSELMAIKGFAFGVLNEEAQLEVGEDYQICMRRS